jgi:hypothetical protein
MPHRNRIPASLLGAFCFLLLICAAPRPARAATTGRNLTVTLNPYLSGITVVDQTTGAVTICQGMWAGNLSGAKCGKIGKATPTTNAAAAPTGLTVIQGQYYQSGTTQPSPDWEIWIINNQTGDITVCSTLDPNNTLTGSCVNLGIAPQ